MDIAVLSDIHGNYVALEKCIQYVLKRGIDTFFFLGDYIGELAYPERTMKRLYEMQRKYHCTFIKGNKEEYWLAYRENGETGWEFGNSTTGSLLYEYERLTDEDMTFYEALPIVRKVMFEGLPLLTICHGSPERTKQKLLPDDEITKRIMVECETDIIICGHTHRQGIIENRYKGFGCKQVWNPGSVGVALGSEGRTQCMILHGKDGCWTPEMLSLEYDQEAVIRDLHEAGLDKYAPFWCKITEVMLKDGMISHGEVLDRAMELCRQEAGECNWPHIPEKYWEKAYGEMVENRAEV